MSISRNERIRSAEPACLNQQTLLTALKSECGFIVCGSGPSRSVLARRRAESAEVNVLQLEGGRP
jgi:choline dehydrogenase